MRRMILWLGAVLVAAGCEGGAPGAPTAPTALNLPLAAITVPESTLTFLRPAPGAPSIAAKTVSFWAVNGETRTGVIRYRKRPGAPASNRLVRLVVDKRSLVNRPDGTPIAVGDSILIRTSL